MKKVAVLGLASLFLLTGCGSKKVTCSSSEGKIIATVKGDKVTKIGAEIDYGSKELAKAACKLDKKAKCSGSNVKYDDAASQMGITKDELSKLTVKEFKSGMKAMGFSCK